VPTPLGTDYLLISPSVNTLEVKKMIFGTWKSGRDKESEQSAINTHLNHHDSLVVILSSERQVSHATNEKKVKATRQ